MVHRFALIGGAVAAAGILVLAFGVGGLFARSSPDATSQPSASAATPDATTQVDTVYVKPAPPQQVIHVTQNTHPSAARQTPRVVVVHRSGHGGEGGGDGEHDGGD